MLPKDARMATIGQQGPAGRAQANHQEETPGMDSWITEFPAAITVCDTAGIIVEMNDLACETFAAEGGAALIGTSLLACHPEPARTKVEELLRSGTGNVYTIEKGGKRKLIFQSPWFKEGIYRGLVEISLPLPAEVPHFIRDRSPDG
jgi:PAS domain-containing protein